MPLTEAEKTAINYQNDIERLSAQKMNLQAQVEGLASQCNDLYEKRSKAAQEVEIMKIEAEKGLKNVDLERAKLVSLKKENEDKETKLKIGGQKLSEEKEAFRLERKIYENRLKELEENEGKNAEKSKALDAREKKLNDLQDELDIRERKFNSEISDLKSNLESALNSAKSELISAKQEKEEAEKLKKEVAQKLANNEAANEELKKKLAEDKKVSDADADAIKQHLKKRELGIVEKEKELSNLKLEYQAKIDDLKIKEGREASGVEAPKEKKKK